MGPAAEIDEIEHVIAFDGVCNLCNFWVNFLIDRDRKQIFKFVSLQVLIDQKHIEFSNLGMDSIHYYKAGTLYKKSDAVLQIARSLGFPFSIVVSFYILPRSIRDRIYDFVARNRYRWFGQRNTCRVPTAQDRDRFLDSSLLPNFEAKSTKTE
jgi:predicted DCC family thiol-disulfide oxidoreductase YuxK